MSEKYVDTLIWLRSTGCVTGVPLEWINEKIDQFNSSAYLRNNADFWEWLSWEEGEEFKGFSSLWHSKLMSQVHTIKGRSIQDNA